MPLPKISTPTYELTLPSNKKKIKYRPFLVREEKILIIAMESEDTTQITNAISEVLNSCILTKGIDVESLPTFDIEYLFLHVRAKSVGESVDVIVTCADDGETQVPVSIDLQDIEVTFDEKHSRDIKIDDTLSMRMKYPSLDQFIKNNFDFDGRNIDNSFQVIAGCIEQIYNAEEAWSAADSTQKELIEFLEQLGTKQFKEIEEFFNTMPKLSYTIKVINPNTKVENEVVLEGLSSFFG